MNNKNDFSANGSPELEFGLTRKRLFSLIIITGLILVGTGLAFLQLENVVTGEGRIYADEEWYVYAPEEERIEQVVARIGDTVQKGDPLFRLNSSDLDLELIRRKETLLRTREELAALGWEIKLAEIRPENPEILTAGDRLELLRQIEDIQNMMTRSLSNLADQRAIRSLEYYRQQVENLRTQMDSANTRWWLVWQENGMWDLEKSKLQTRHEHLQAIAHNLESEIELLNQKRSALEITAPISGEVVEIYFRHNGMKPVKGDRLAKIAVQNGRYRVRTYLNQRNYDLVRAGMPARMESEVFNSILEGYIRGTVIRVGKDSNYDYSNAVSDASYEVWIEVKENPYPLLLGSTVKVDILMGKASIWEILLKKPDTRRALKIDNTGDQQP